MSTTWDTPTLLNMSKLLKTLFYSIAINICQHIENKKSLCIIMINDKLSDEEKLNCVRKKILEFEARSYESGGSENFIKVFSEEAFKMDSRALLATAKYIDELIAPVKKYEETLEKIGAVLRSSVSTNQAKVDQIMNLLI